MFRLLESSRASLRRLCSQMQKSEGELKIESILRDKFASASHIKVEDVSGGCGSMYEVHIHSDQFGGLLKVQQHKLVNQALREQIQGMHGIRIFTKTPENDKQS